MEKKVVSEEGSHTKIQNADVENLEVKCKLLSLECPFTWDFLADLIAPIRKWLIISFISKLEEPDPILQDSEGKNEWRRLAMLVLLGYMERDENINKALEEIKACENIINQLDEKQPRFLDENKVALKHIVLATKAHLMNNSSSIQLVLQEIDKNPLSSMTKKELAGIKGFKAEVLLQLGNNGHSLSLPFAEAAISLDEKESYWWFLAGKALGRIRRLAKHWDHKVTTDDKEITYLQKAVELKNHPLYRILLALAYAEISSVALHSQPPAGPERYRIRRGVNEMQKKSYELYKSCMDDKSIPAHTLIRCAHGLLKLAHPYKKVDEAKIIIDKCLALSPDNAYIHHVAAMLYESHEHDLVKALQHLEISGSLGNFDADLHKISVKCYSDELYDPYNDLKLCKQKYAEETLLQILEREFGMYYLICKQNLMAALKHFSAVIKEGKGSSLKNVRNNFAGKKSAGYKKINALEAIVDESRLALIQSTNNEEKIILENFLADIKQFFPELLEKQPKPGQIEKLVNISQGNSYNQTYRRGRFL